MQSIIAARLIVLAKMKEETHRRSGRLERWVLRSHSIVSAEHLLLITLVPAPPDGRGPIRSAQGSFH